MSKIFTLKNYRNLPKPLAWLLAGLLRLYAWTFRVRIEDPFGIFQNLDTRVYTFAIWHNRVLFAAPVLPSQYRRRMTALISASRDGEYISTLVKCFDVHMVRGSSSHGGARALIELRRAMKQGYSPFLTVDGPRGPRYTIHPGAVALSVSGKVPLVPMLFNAKHYWQLRSWDRMQIPWPFTRMTITIGKPLELAPEVSIDEGCERLRQALMEITNDYK